MFCPKCGSENAQSSESCSNCGSDFTSRTQNGLGAVEVDSQSTLQPIHWGLFSVLAVVLSLVDIFLIQMAWIVAVPIAVIVSAVLTLLIHIFFLKRRQQKKEMKT